MPHILFVCTGNICRSPLAEALLRHHSTAASFAHPITVQSAGVEGYHIGEKADPRTRHLAKLRGIDMDSQRAQKVSSHLIEKADYVFAMDFSHLRRLLQSFSEHRHKIHLFLEFCDAEHETSGFDVPDPYYGEEPDFIMVHELLNDAVLKFLSRI
jgi:protein-tyrosine phosphatase